MPAGGPLPARLGFTAVTLAAVLGAAALGSDRRAHAARTGGADGTRRPVTFTRDVAPIIFSRCAPCHRPGEVGPFSLLSYADVARRARQILEVTSRRLMPPWPPEPGYGEFEGERRLSDAEIATIRLWIEDGLRRGDPAAMPPVPRLPAGWQLGTPDLVVTMPEPYALPAGGPDIFRKFVLPIPVSGTRYVRAVEFRPGNARVVHHAIMHIDRSGVARRLDALDDEPGVGGMIFPEGETPGGHFLGWSPGRMPTAPPEDLAWRLDEGTDLLLQLHLLPTGRPESIRASVGFYFAKRPPSRVPVGLQLGTYVIDIPPGERHYVVEDRYVLPVDVEIHAIYPHAHYLGKDIQAYALRPDGTTQWLIWIRDWDFYWQGEYRYRRPVALPAGTTLVVRFTYDNSSANPRNPFDPPRRVVYGGQSSDEMANLWLQVVPRDARDRARLEEDYARKAASRYAAGYLRMLEADPEHPAVHRGLGFAYLRMGDVDKALVHLREALRLGADDALVHYNLGNARAAQGAVDDAIGHYRDAIAADPQLAEAYNNLGVMLQAQGRFADALESYRKALALRAAYPEAHNNAGVMLQAMGRLDEAIAHFKEAVRLNPDYALARANLEAALRARGGPR
ncbi:MAG TPA: tetratricopeptide repeat protein [Vicinamibacterales bacterium]|nr:tetratricopeptide repeat protein [Vicinamibacterales bacterium]